MPLLLLLLAFLALNALVAWRGADSRDGRDWTAVPRLAPVRGTAVASRMITPAQGDFGIATPPGTRASVGEKGSTSSADQRM